MNKSLSGLACGLAVVLSAFGAEPDDLCTAADYRAVTVEGKGLIPYAEQMALHIRFGAFRDPHGRDFVAEGLNFCGKRRVLHCFLRMEGGVPVYAPAEPFPEGPDPLDKECRNRFDVDGDGVEDLLVADWSYQGARRGYPWAGADPWNDKPSLYSGAGRGYDIFGRWLGFEAIGEIFWAKGTKGADGKVTFGEKRNVLCETPGFERLKGLKRALTWKMFHGITAACILKTRKGRWLVMEGDVDALVALPISCRDGEVYCGEARPLLKTGLRMLHGYLSYGLYPVDLDLDGQDELLCDGNPGVVACFKGDEPGDFTSSRVWLEGGDICVETLAEPTRFDWDGDGKPDLILSDSTGWLTFWGGTDDPLVYRASRPFTRDGGKPWLVPAGENGSMQGIWERCWGYVKPTAGTWRGKNVILTSDVRGDLMLRVPTKGDILELRDVPFRQPNGTSYKVAWRCKPDFVLAKTGFAGVKWDSFLVQDLDGDAAVAEPESKGAFVIGRTAKLTYADGRPIRLCGVNGLWGRGHFALVDWDGDGALDFLFSSDRACQRFFRPDLKLATSQPFLFRNVGSNAKPLFAKGVPLRLKRNGRRLSFLSHNATSCVSDWTGDGRPDLMVGAENGRVYAFEHDELFVRDE